MRLKYRQIASPKNNIFSLILFNESRPIAIFNYTTHTCFFYDDMDDMHNIHSFVIYTYNTSSLRPKCGRFSDYYHVNHLHFENMLCKNNNYRRIEFFNSILSGWMIYSLILSCHPLCFNCFASSWQVIMAYGHLCRLASAWIWSLIYL